MTQETARYVLWALLCLPLLVLACVFLFRLMDDAIGINRVKAARRKAVQDEKKRLEEERRRRQIFDEDYQDYQRRKYSED